MGRLGGRPVTRELFAQRRRVADAERALQTKETKKARDDVRIGSNKVAAAQRRLDVLKGKASSQDSRIYPGTYCPVMVMESGQRVVRLMRYQYRTRPDNHQHQARACGRVVATGRVEAR